MQEATFTLRDYLSIANRRRWFLIVPTCFIVLLFVVLAIVWPPSYRSEAVVLVEQPEIPNDLVSNLIGDYLERRLEAINRRVLVTDNLIRIMERYNLYPREREKRTITDVASDMRDNIGMDLISTDVADPTTGRNSSSTVAFKLSFTYDDADTAQRITNEIVSLYLNENLRQRRERATQTAGFLTAERQRAEQQIQAIEAQLTTFRDKNNGSLPDQLLYNQQIVGRASQELRDIDRQLQTAREQQASLQAQLALVDPNNPYGTGRPSPEMQLDSMRVDLASATGRYGPDHPDVRRLSREVASLERSLGVSSNVSSLQEQVDRAQQDYDSLRQRYTESHPDVQRAKRSLNAALASLASARSSAKRGGSSADKADNPAYIQLQGQLESTQAQIPALVEQRSKVLDEFNHYQELVMKAPSVAADYDGLQRNLEQAVSQRNELSEKESTAQLGLSVESELKGERFSLIEPPNLPTSPVGHKRLLILAIGMVLAIATGFGSTAAAHLLDDGIYSAKDIIGVVGEGPIAVIPKVYTRVERARQWSIRLASIIIAIVSIVLVGWLIHTRVMPLDVAFYTIQQRLTDFFSLLFSSSSTLSPG